MALDTDTMTALRDAVRRYVRERLVPLETWVAENDRLPPDVVQEMREMGLFGLTVPEEYGGLGLSLAQEVEIIFELTWASLAFRSITAMNLGVGSQALVKEGTAEQQAEWLPRIASGEIITSFALTEPGSGSDSAALRTTAVRDGDDYVLNGTKRFISNAPHAGLITVIARTSSEKLPGNAHLTAFLVPAGTPGLEIAPADHKMGQQGAATADVILDDVRVPASAIIGGREGRGFATAMKVLDRGRVGVAAACIGQAQRLIQEMLDYGQDRQAFGQAIAEFQLVQAMMADSMAEMASARALVRETAARFDAGERISREASCCKMLASEMVGRVADRAVQIHGGTGYIRGVPVERMFRDVRVLRIYEGTTQIQQLVIAKDMLRHGL
ncbi:acyl-CoA dehydrogenase family protein [Sphingomonas crocodyli]|uniref:Cyclohexane-1-carbonyl-CoA dehydrogenase n=1 Tax=Sphingomonas crocodyli TaxID=1979270 RepID=A0A437M918_9SPHN|nr:acyl-CoA dehydrogenase family protein [Sphingomonas crocodyli]RVT94210.1 acyl-CoA dehydrogenase [Sphingomonas crocodyli]